MIRKRSPNNRAAKYPAFRVRLPGFVGEDELGLGEVLSRVTTSLGIRPCGGCKKRASALNRLVVFSNKGLR